MGGLCTKSNTANMEFRKSQQIQKQLQVDFDEDSGLNLLLLGSGEGGKSTLLKQMKILHLNGFDKKQMFEYRKIIFGNIASVMTTLLMAMDTLEIPLKNRELEAKRNTVFEWNAKRSAMLFFPDDLYKGVSMLWADSGVQQCYARRSEFQLIDSAKYFMDSLDRIHLNDYVPTTQDALMARASTTGIVDVVFPFKENTFRVFDVGGQKSERRKWIHCFEGIPAVIFVAALNEYDQVLKEDESVNRMKDSAEFFKDVCSNQWFLDSIIILFLNKRDLFEEKIKTTSIKSFFRDFNGPETYDSCVSYISNFFLKYNHNPEKTIKSHVTCATDTNQVQQVIDDVIQGLLDKNVRTMPMH